MWLCFLLFRCHCFWALSNVILFFIAPDFNFTTRHIHNWALYLLWPSLFILTGAIIICSSPIEHWIPFNLRGLSSGIISFCVFILSIGISRQEYLTRLLFVSPMDHILSELFTVTRLSWWPCSAWLIASLGYTSPFATTRLSSMKVISKST